MVNQQLLDYIKQQAQQGINIEQIKNSLVVSGWSLDNIEMGIAAALPKPSEIPLPPIPSIEPTSNFTNSVTSISYAGFWLRVAANIIDSFILSLVFTLINFLVFWFFAPNSLLLLMNIFYSTISFIYFSLMESRGGATLGKKMVGIKVSNANGGPVEFLRSLGRNLAKIISALILMIGFMMVGFTKKKQGLHDIITSCVVIKDREVSVGKIWTFIVLIAIAWFLLIPLSLFIGSMRTQGSSDQSPVTQVQNNESDLTVSQTGTSVPLAKEGYDTYFSKPIKGLDAEKDYKGPRTYAGPALIAFDGFWDLNVALPIIPNLENPSGVVTQDSKNQYAWIDLTSVTSKDGKEILDAKSVFEGNIFKFLSLSKKTDPIEYLSGRRSINFITGAKSSDAKTIKGVLSFKIPLESKDPGSFYEKSYPFIITIPNKTN